MPHDLSLIISFENVLKFSWDYKVFCTIFKFYRIARVGSPMKHLATIDLGSRGVEVTRESNIDRQGTGFHPKVKLLALPTNIRLGWN